MALDEVMDAFALLRKTRKANTVADYRKRIREIFADGADKPLALVTRDMIAAQHAEISRRSPSQANKGMRVLRALFNCAKGALDDGKGGFVITGNPVERLTKARAWNGSERRRTLIEPHQFRAWFAAVLKLQERPGGGLARRCGITCSSSFSRACAVKRLRDCAVPTWTFPAAN